MKLCLSLPHVSARHERIFCEGIANTLWAAGYDILEGPASLTTPALTADDDGGLDNVTSVRDLLSRHWPEFDARLHMLEACDAYIAILPAADGSLIELGYVAALQKKTFALLNRPPPTDLMYKLCSEIVTSPRDLISALRRAFPIT